MKKQSFITKVLALSMALLMLLSMFPVSAADASGNTEAPTVESSGNVTDENGSSENTGDATEIVPAETQTSVPETTGEGEESTLTDAVDTPTVAPTEEPTQAPTEEPFEVPGEITYKYELPEKAKQAKDGETDYFTDLSKITVTVPVTVATVAGEDTVQAPKFAFLSKSKYEENKTDFGWLTDEVTVVEKKKDGAVVAFVATIDVSKIFKTTDAKNGKYVLVTSAAGSEDVVKNIVFDNTAPVLSVSYSATPVNGWFTDTVTVNCTVTDDSPCTINGNSTNNYSFTVTNEGKNNYSIQAVDIFGNPSKEDIEVNVDKTAPIFGSGTKFAEIWTNDDANLTVAVTDELSGVNVDNKFGITFKGETTETAPSGLVGENKYGLSIPDAQNGEYTITVYDKAGHKNSFIATMSYVDKDAPVASDFKVSITPADTALSKILNIITFGIYANKDVNVTVSADSNGNAPISNINMYVNGSEEAQKAESNAIEGDVYSETYKFSKDTIITDIKFDATDEADNKSDKISITDEGVVVTAGGVELEGEFKELIITEAAPEISATVTTGVENKEVNDINYLKEAGNVTLKVESQDNLTGIDGGLVAYFGKEENFTYDAKNNKWTVKDLEPLSISGSSTADALPAAFAIDLDSSDKVTSANAEYTVKVEEDGTYLFLALATNNASNTGYSLQKFFVDNKGPKVEFVEFPTEWAKEHTVEFKVTDLPEPNCVGVDDKCIVKVIGSDGKAIVNNNIIYNEVDGTYSFIVNSNKSYTITVKDILGNENSQETPEVVKADGKSPVISDFSYSNDNNNEWTAENVKVSFDVTDELSGVAEVKVVGADGKEAKVEKNDSTYFFTANKQQTYTVTATDKAGNTTPDNKVKTTEEIKFENAEPIISKIVFEEGNSNVSGGYSDKAVVVKVYAISGNNNKNNSGISKILLTNNKTENIKKNPEQVAMYIDNGYSVQEFILEPPKKYMLSIQAFSGTGIEKEAINLSGVATYIGDELKENSKLYEYVVDNSSPIVSFGNDKGLQDFDGVNIETDTVYYSGTSGTVSATVSNELSGINVESIKVYFGKSSQFTNNIPDKNELKPLDNVEITRTFDSENKDKVVSVNLEAKVDTPDSGNYVLFVMASTLSKAEAFASQTIKVDNSGPKISNVSYNTKWTNQPIVVSFTVSDNALGVKEVEVVGTDGDKCDLTSTDTDGTYTFTSEKYQKYIITAKDKYGNKTVYGDDENEKIETLYDVEKPVVEIESYNDGANTWTNSDVEVKFTVTDKYSGVNQADIIVTDTEGNTYSTTLIDTDKYKFTADKYDDFDIVVTDIADNTSKKVTTEKIKYDNTAPEFSGIKFENINNSTVVSKVLNFLTFGIYGNTDVVMTVTAEDEATTDQYTASSLIKDITVTYNGDPLEKKSYSHTQNDVNTDKAVQTFILKSETAYDADKFQFSVTDVADNGSGDTLSNLRGLISVPDGTSLNEDFEIVLTSDPSEITGIETKYTQNPVTNSDGVVVYDGENATYTTTIKEELSGINTETIVGYFGKAEYFTISEDGKTYEIDEANVEVLNGLFGDGDITKNEKGKVTAVNISYLRNDVLETGEYVFLVKATNNAGNGNIWYTNTFVDSSVPVIDENITYSNKVDSDAEQKWSKDKVTVTFKATDVPSENFCGIESVKVVGLSNGREYLNNDAEGVLNGTFSFEADYCQKYKITVSDMFGRTTTTETATVLYDDKLPEIVDIQYYDYFEVYGGDIELKDFNNRTEFDNEKWKDEDIIVKFTVDDRNDLADDISDIKKFAECENDLPVVVSGTELDKDGKVKSYKVNEITPEDATKGVHTYYFVADRYDTYVITATDIAGNVSEDSDTGTDYKTEFIKIDKVAPTVSNIKFVDNPDATDKILNFLTFGLYSSGAIDMIVTAEDEYASSDFSDLIVKITGKDFKTNDIITHEIDVEDITSKDGDNSERIIKETIEIPSDLVIDSDDITITITDTAGNKLSKSLVELYDVIENKDILDSKFEIYAGEGKAEISRDVKDEDALKYPEDSEDNKDGNEAIKWYANSENITIEYTITDEYSKISSVNVLLNNKHNVTKYCTFVQEASMSQVEGEEGIFTKPSEHTGNKMSLVDLSLKLEDIDRLLNCASKNAENNVITVTATSNNGLSVSDTLEFKYIDDEAPQITSFMFEKEEVITKDDSKGSFIISSDLPKEVIKKDYGYFFKEKTTVTVKATDKITNSGSGISEVVLYGIEYETNKRVDFGSCKLELSKDKQDVTAEFEIPANFKGSIFAYIVDKVKNRSDLYSPNNAIVENEAKHNENSYAKVSIVNDDNLVGKDNKGYKLFNGNVKVKIEIADTYTGLENVTYTINAIGYGGKTVTVLDDRNLTDPNSQWKIKEQHDNIVQKLERTITFTPQVYNYNSIQVTVKGIDNAGFEIEAASELFSIDTIAPKIEIDYNNVSGNTDRDGKTYYKDTRVATVTVRERNFDPDDFDWSGVVNGHGSPVPRAEGTSNWSTNYSDFTENSTHTAILTFSQDGDYSIDLAFEDMATNSDTEKGEEFTIDTIDPVVEVSYDNNNARNGKYYAQGRTATITVREHNFDPTDMYVTYTPSATGPDNSTSATPPTISWGSPSGDVCTGTIVFDRNGSYQFTLRVKDKSLRESTEFTQEEFVVDTYIGTVENDKDSSIEFKNVKNENAYAGEIRPQVVLSDYNYDDSTLSLRKISYDYKTKKSVEVNANHLIPHAVSSSFGVTYSFDNFPVIEDNDGIYILTATIMDKAGNPHERKIMFSVNRFGSTFMLGDEKSEKLVDDTYTNDAPNLSIIEINVNPVTAQTVTLSKNTTSEKLEKGKQYTIGEEGNKNKWYKYTYKINKANFNDEGDYTVTVSSEDKDGNVVSNRTAQTKKRNCPVSFVVDKTKPVVSIEGLDEGYTKEASQDVRISCLDANLDKDSLVIKKNGEVLKVDEDYTVEDLVGELTAEFTLKSEGGQTDYDIEVSVKDYANNENGDDVQDYIINATLLTQYLNSPLAIILTFVLLAAVAVIIILIVRKKKQEE